MEFTFSAAVEAVKVKVGEVAGCTVRSCEMRFGCEFDDMIARSLGGEARTVLDALRNFALEQAILPLDAIDATGTFKAAKDSVEIQQLRGVKAVCKAGDHEKGTPPRVELHFQSIWSEDAWVFLGRHSGVFVEVNLADRQLSMPLGGGKAA